MNSHKKGAVFVVSGPSGVGKDTVLKELMPRLGDRAVMSVSNTTRPPRSGEVDGVDYNFIGEDEFRRAIAEGKMLEYTEYCSVLYGTPLDPIKNGWTRAKRSYSRSNARECSTSASVCPRP